MQDPEPPILDASVLDELAASVGGDAQFVAELIRTYLDDAGEHMAGIQAAMGDGDAEALVRPAHTLKSSSATVGAMRLAALARRLELAGRSNDISTDGVTGDAGDLPSQWAAAQDALRAWLEQHGT
jgi:HPt (histidine-containing phosphotransfer) domain-containing protein